MVEKNIRRWPLAEVEGVARIRFLDDGEEFAAELHLYESRGIGKVEMKIKDLLD
jgi:hypothetical protein